MTVSFEAEPYPVIPRLDIAPDPEYQQAALVSVEGLAGAALSKYLKQISPTIHENGVDKHGNDRLITVISMRHTDKLRRLRGAGFRIDEIDNPHQTFRLQLAHQDSRAEPIRVDGAEYTVLLPYGLRDEQGQGLAA